VAKKKKAKKAWERHLKRCKHSLVYSKEIYDDDDEINKLYEALISGKPVEMENGLVFSVSPLRSVEDIPYLEQKHKEQNEAYLNNKQSRIIQNNE
jgi:hypothetical protein